MPLQTPSGERRLRALEIEFLHQGRPHRLRWDAGGEVKIKHQEDPCLCGRWDHVEGTLVELSWPETPDAGLLEASRRELKRAFATWRPAL